jgi:hypothetical protein
MLCICDVEKGGIQIVEHKVSSPSGLATHAMRILGGRQQVSRYARFASLYVAVRAHDFRASHFVELLATNSARHLVVAVWQVW